uniref:Uncharacterized protein n=1 Tax=Romanomermis culicivorax TaxID=13658 RepID=A0A915KEU5_ROMCU
MSDCRNDVDGLLKNRKAAMNPRVSLEMSSAHMAETVAFKVRFLGKNLILRASSYSCGEMSMLPITQYASKWIALMMGSLFFFRWSVRNFRWSAPSKETMMVSSPSTREKSPVQSSGVAVKVSKTNIVPLGNVS